MAGFMRSVRVTLAPRIASLGPRIASLRAMNDASSVRSMSLASTRPRCVVLNAARLDFDGRISFDRIADVANVTRHEISEPSQVVERVAEHEVVLNKEMPLPGDLIRAFPPSVKLICEAGTGYNNIDLVAARERGISVCNVPTYATEAMAHMAVTLIMALACSLWPQAQALARGDRSYMHQCHLGALPHFELTGKTLGLIGGLGTIGLRVGAMAQALGLKVVASSSRTHLPAGLREDGIEVVGFEELLARSDFVSVHCPLNAQTKGLVNAAALAQMKPSAYIVNTACAAVTRSCPLPISLTPAVAPSAQAGLDHRPSGPCRRAARAAHRRCGARCLWRGLRAAAAAARRQPAPFPRQCHPHAAHWLAAARGAPARRRYVRRQHCRLCARRAGEH